MGTGLRDYVVANYSWKEVANQYSMLYERVILERADGTG